MITVNIRESKQCNGNYSAFVSFPYDENIVSVIRNQPTRYWNKDKKEWEVPTKQLINIIAKLNDYNITLTGQLSELNTAEF